MTAEHLFSINLKYIREKANLTKAATARLLGITQKRYSQWEYMNATPGFSFLVEIADLFDVGIDNLLTIDLKKSEERSENDHT